MHWRFGIYVRRFAHYLVACLVFDCFILCLLPMGSDMCSALANPFVLKSGRIFVCGFINAAYGFWAIVLLFFEIQMVQKVHLQAQAVEQGEHTELLRYERKSADQTSTSSGSKLPEQKAVDADEDKWDRERAFDIADSLENGLAREIVTEFMHPLRRASKLWKFHVRNLPSDIKEKEVKYIFSKYGAVRSADVIMWPGLPSLCPNGSLAPLEISLANRQKIDWQACAFITYSTADAAAVAIRALNGVYRPRSSSPEPLVVMLARPGALPDPVQHVAEVRRSGAEGTPSTHSRSGLMPPPAEDQVALLIGADKGGNFSSSTAQMASATASYVAEKTRCKLFVGNLHAEIPRERLSQVFGECGRVVNVHVMTGKSKFGSACAFVEMATPAEAESALKALHQKYEPRIGSMTAPVTVTYFQSQSSGKAAQTLAGPAAGFSSGGFSRYTPYQSFFCAISLFAGCVTACSPAIEPLPKKVLSSEPKEISELWPGEELLNDVIQRLWPSISEWFQRKLKAELEPELKKQLLDIVEFEATIFAARNGATDYSGDGQITVGIRAGGGGAVGHVALTKLKLRGKIVVELAHLTHLPPWFSGIRIYFPDMPEVDLTIDAKVFVLDAFCDTASLVKTRVLKVLREAVANACVLPSRLVLETTTGVDHFRLHHPRPRGVLRTQLEVQSSAEAELREEAPAESRYPYLNALNSWLFDSSRPTSLTSIQVALGACTRNCASGDVLDFVVDDLDQQPMPQLS
eukprot:g8631.t1